MMNLSSTSFRIQALPYKSGQFHQLVRKMISESHCDLEQACDLLGVKKQRLNQALDVNSPDSLAIAIRACEKLNISLAQLIEGQVDWEFVRTSLQNGHQLVPHRYREAGFSRVRTIQNILSFLDARFGKDYRNQILRKLQLHENMFQDPNALVNMRLAIDLVDLLEQETGIEAIGYQIGLHSPSLHLGGPRSETHIKDAHDAFREFFDKNANRVESNRAWRIVKHDRKKIVVESVSNPSVVQALENKYLLSESAEMIRLGYLASIPAHYGLPQARAWIEKQKTTAEDVSVYRIVV